MSSQKHDVHGGEYSLRHPSILLSAKSSKGLMTISKGYNFTAVHNFREMLGRLLSQTKHDVFGIWGLLGRLLTQTKHDVLVFGL